VPVQSNFRVEVSKDYLVFASAHFITFRGHQCESLHGHNYRVGVAVEGAVDSECMFVLDFSILKRIVRSLVDQIDHKVLLPTQNQNTSFPRVIAPCCRLPTRLRKCSRNTSGAQCESSSSGMATGT
jgi:6-pyruvoyl tetrahydropterin synthase/QueD family protein